MKFLKVVLICSCFSYSLQAFAIFNLKSKSYKGTEVTEEDETEARSPVDVPRPQDDECCNRQQTQDWAFGFPPHKRKAMVHRWLGSKKSEGSDVTSSDDDAEEEAGRGQR